MVVALVVLEEVSPSASAAPWRKKGIRTYSSAVKLSEVIHAYTIMHEDLMALTWFPGQVTRAKLETVKVLP